MTAPTIAHARKMQLEAAAAIEATGWDERGVVPCMAWIGRRIQEPK